MALRLSCSMHLRILPALIAILSFLPSLGCRAESAKSLRVEADFNTLVSVVKVYQLNARQLPPPELGQQALITRPDSLFAKARWVQIMDRVQLDPWGKPYRYLAGEGLKNGFGFYSCGPDGKTSSAGNDPDDLNSWTEIDHARYDNVGLRKIALAVGAVASPPESS